ncbi:MAG: iron-sulfur cluster assembly protein [bacterium]|nr:iron-sulfur cluster assembly protein [bacterium]
MITQETVMNSLKNVFDPEIPVNIVDLGLIYGVDVKDDNVTVDMTLTASGCPMASYVSKMAEDELKKIAGIKEIKVNIVWEPPWSPDMMSEDAKKKLGWT